MDRLYEFSVYFITKISQKNRIGGTGRRGVYYRFYILSYFTYIYTIIAFIKAPKFFEILLVIYVYPFSVIEIAQ